ncbi:MAG: hypothetical protein JWQ43_1870 [Glaciihabitans sp.]|nr:hypothetical protein [Glaciihabitans sp.]
MPDRRIRWGLNDAALGIAAFLTVLGLVAIAASAVDPRYSDAVGFVANALTYGALFGAVFYASRRHGLRSLGRDFGFRLRWIDLLIGLAVGVVAKLSVVAYVEVARLVTGAGPTTGNLELSSDTLWVLLNGVIFASLVAPIVEELFMRGLLLRSIRNAILRGWLGRRPQPAERRVQLVAIVLSIGGSSFIFMLLHLWQSSDPALLIVLGLSTFTLGVLNGLIAIRTGRIGAAIVAHVVFNGSSVLLQAVGVG